MIKCFRCLSTPLPLRFTRTSKSLEILAPTLLLVPKDLTGPVWRFYFGHHHHMHLLPHQCQSPISFFKYATNVEQRKLNDARFLLNIDGFQRSICLFFWEPVSDDLDRVPVLLGDDELDVGAVVGEDLVLEALAEHRKEVALGVRVLAQDHGRALRERKKMKTEGQNVQEELEKALGSISTVHIVFKLSLIFFCLATPSSDDAMHMQVKKD